MRRETTFDIHVLSRRQISFIKLLEVNQISTVNKSETRQPLCSMFCTYIVPKWPRVFSVTVYFNRAVNVDTIFFFFFEVEVLLRQFVIYLFIYLYFFFKETTVREKGAGSVIGLI